MMNSSDEPGSTAARQLYLFALTFVALSNAVPASAMVKESYTDHAYLTNGDRITGNFCDLPFYSTYDNRPVEFTQKQDYGVVTSIGANFRVRQMRSNCMRHPVIILLALWTIPLSAQEEQSAPQSEAGYIFALPVEIEADSGATNGGAIFMRIVPLYSIALNRNWRLVNLDLLTIADSPGGVPGRPGNPEPIPGERVFGLGDLVHASLFTPKQQKNHIWGAGLMLSMPSATNETLGSGKWAAGPAVRVTYKTGLWSLSALAGNRWSFAGNSNRADINQLMVRGLIRKQMPDDWFFVSAPIITANWNAASGERWLLPVGGGFGRQFDIRSRPWSWSFQGYFNLIRPDGAPEWAIRFAMIAAIPAIGS
jgi:hypothetical protein